MNSFFLLEICSSTCRYILKTWDVELKRDNIWDKSSKQRKSRSRAFVISGTDVVNYESIDLAF